MKYIIGIILSVFLIIAGVKTQMTIEGYSEGNRVVTLEKVSKKGLIWKTYEGTGVLGTGTNSDGVMVRKLWKFSLKDAQVMSQLDTMAGKKVKLFYKQNYITGYKDGSTSYIVYKGERVK